MTAAGSGQDETGTAMSETTGTPALNEALAKFQADLPRVGKDNTARVDHKDGGFHKYKYADLADISSVALPLLGKFGLAFTAKPTTLPNGAFVLHYKLTHSSGELDEGFYQLPDPGRTDPQKVGSAITYARRYCLCAVTGIHPDGEDDDAAAAQTAPYTSRSESWENATPAPPRNRNGNGRGQQAGDSPGREPTADDLDPDAQSLADEAYVATSLRELDEVKRRARDDEHKLDSWILSPGNGKIRGLGQLIAWKRSQLEDVEKALAELHRNAGKARIAAADLDAHVQKITGQTIEGATAAQLRQAAAALSGQPAQEQGPAVPTPGTAPADDAKWVQEFIASLTEAMSSGALSGLQQRLGPAIADRTITAETAADLSSQIAAKRRELQGAPA